MNALTGDIVVMPTWVFMLLLLGGMVLIAFLLWANNTQADDLRRERHRRAVHNHLHHDGPDPEQLRLNAAIGIPAQRDGGER